jgi:hypothetical protein
MESDVFSCYRGSGWGGSTHESTWSDHITPFIDIFNPGDNFTTTFEIYVRNFGSGTAAGQRLREHIQDWDQAGRPASAKWHIRAVPAESEYHPTDGEFLVDKPWTKLIIRYQ